MTIENVKNAIALLEAIDPSDEYAYERAFLAYMTVKKLPVFVFNIEKGIEVFRARTGFDDGLFEQISDIALPPHEVIKSFARCNRPYQSKFYCAENRATSYIELAEYWADNRNVGEKLYATIGRWVIKRPFLAIIVTSPYPEQRQSAFDKYHGEGLDRILSEYEGEFKEANILIYNYLFEKFRKSAKKDPHTYLVTSAYCNIAFSRSADNIDAIYYPSVPFNGQGVNFAFNNKFITKENIELVGALKDELTVYTNDAGKKSFHQTEVLEAKAVDYATGLINW
ncbi:MAG: hypothetical protein V4708_03065 [Bacteroidota bacterium]